MTLCVGEILDLPVTTEITSLPQLTADGVSLALARRAAEATRLANAAAELAARGETVTSRALAEAAHISLNTACTWLRTQRTDTLEPAPLLSALQYSSYCIPDNSSASANEASTAAPGSSRALADPPERSAASTHAPAPTRSGPPPSHDACPAASHRLFWRLSAGAWRCPVCLAPEAEALRWSSTWT